MLKENISINLNPVVKMQSEKHDFNFLILIKEHTFVLNVYNHNILL
jgi:hypothetical protein